VWEQIIYYASLAAAGGLGQGLRSILGLKKAVEAGDKFSTKRLVLTMISGFLTGAAIGIWTNSYRAAFVGGLGSTDILESLVDVVKK